MTKRHAHPVQPTFHVKHQGTSPLRDSSAGRPQSTHTVRSPATPQQPSTPAPQQPSTATPQHPNAKSLSTRQERPTVAHLGDNVLNSR